MKQQDKTTYQETVDKYCYKIEKPAEIGKSVSFYVIHGIFYRNETCATEIYNECFGNDRRKSIFRIREILSKPDEWQRYDTGKKNFAMCYGDQRIIYLRDGKLPNIEHWIKKDGRTLKRTSTFFICQKIASALIFLAKKAFGGNGENTFPIN